MVKLFILLKINFLDKIMIYFLKNSMSQVSKNLISLFVLLIDIWSRINFFSIIFFIPLLII